MPAKLNMKTFLRAFLASSPFSAADLETSSLTVIREILFRFSSLVLTFTTGGSAIFLGYLGFFSLAVVKCLLCLLLVVHDWLLFSRNIRLCSPRSLMLVGFVSLIGTVAAGYPEVVMWGFVFPLAFYLVVDKRDSIALNIIWFFIASVLALSVLSPALAVNYILALAATSFFVEVLCLILYRHEESLKQLARRDPLTNALNRRALMEVAEEAVSLRKRYNRPCSALMIDIDHFKSINDTYGHEEGDRVLKNLVKMVTERIRGTDRLFRLGGEEFVVILRDTGIPPAIQAAESLCAVIRSGRLSPLSRVTISCGVVELGSDESVKEWLQRGDRALYQAKNSGRDRVVSIEAP